MKLNVYTAKCSNGHIATYYENVADDTVMFATWENGKLLKQSMITDWWDEVMPKGPVGIIEIPDDEVPEIPEDND